MNRDTRPHWVWGNNWLKFQGFFGKAPFVWKRNLWTILLNSIKENPKDHNMLWNPIGLGNTTSLTDYAQNLCSSGYCAWENLSWHFGLPRCNRRSETFNFQQRRASKELGERRACQLVLDFLHSIPSGNNTWGQMFDQALFCGRATPRVLIDFDWLGKFQDMRPM